MWFKNYPQTLLRSRLSTSKLTTETLQTRHMRQWVIGWSMLNGLLFGPVIYLINQNYDIFLHLAHLQAPYLIEHLEREKLWIFGLLFSTLTASFILGFFFTLRGTIKMLSPLRKIQDHLHHLSRGRWSTPELQFDDPELKPIADSYNYFYRSLQIITRQQLELLGLIKITAHDYDSKQSLEKIRKEKSDQLGLPYEALPTETSSPEKPSPSQRHAS